MHSVLLSSSALAALAALSLQALRRPPGRDAVFWVFLGLATAGPLAWALTRAADTWPTGFGATLWLSVAATMCAYTLIAALMTHAWRLAPLVGGVMLILGALATIWSGAPARPLLAGPDEEAWMSAHVATALATYGVVTVAAVAALATWIQDVAIKRKVAQAFSRILPSMRDCEHLLVSLLVIGEAILALGLATGMALQYRETGSALIINHKSVLTTGAFVVLAGLLTAYRMAGVRGKQAARVVLIGHLLLTLGYPGVKFVTDVLMA